MTTEVVRLVTFEEREYKGYHRQLIKLEGILAQRELELATLQGEIHHFRGRYLSVIGTRYWELDELQALILEAKAIRKPNDHLLRQKAKQARAQADDSVKNSQKYQEKNLLKNKKFKPSESLKKLYREIAKRIHPDLASDDLERGRFQQLMAQANKAYQEGDEIGLKNILHHWKKNSVSTKEDDISTKIDRINQLIQQIQERLTKIGLEIMEIQKTTLYQLKLKVEAAEKKGQDLLLEMAQRLDQQIVIARQEYEQLKLKERDSFVS